MKLVTIRCDRSGVEIDAGRAALDLCPPCLDGLTRWLHDPTAHAVESKGTDFTTKGHCDG